MHYGISSMEIANSLNIDWLYMAELMDLVEQLYSPSDRLFVPRYHSNQYEVYRQQFAVCICKLSHHL